MGDKRYCKQLNIKSFQSPLVVLTSPCCTYAAVNQED